MSLQMGNRVPGPNPSSTVQSPQGAFFSAAQSRPTFPMGQATPQNQGQGPFGSDAVFKGPSGMMFNRPPDSGQGVPTSVQNSPSDRFSTPHQGSGEGPNLPFGPNFASMFRHPPPSRFPPPPNFQTPPPDLNLQSSQGQNISGESHSSRQSGMSGPNTFPGSQSMPHGNSTNFSQAPGTERPQAERTSGPHSMLPNMQMPYTQVMFELFVFFENIN